MPKRGGAREGAGRKPTGKSPRVTVSVTPDLQEAGLDTGSKIKKAALKWVAHVKEKSSK